MSNKANGNFGDFGGTFLPEFLAEILGTLAEKYDELKVTPEFQNDLKALYKNYAGRPSMLYYAERLTKKLGGAKIYLKREDLNHTGAHKINNVVGQGLVAKALGKKKLIAETGAGQHGVATATIAAYLNLDCDIYMGARDMDAQKPNVYRMKALGAKVIPVTAGQGTLKDAVDVALGAYAQDHADTYYLLGSAVGPHPYPTMVRDFQQVIGEEIKEQMLAEVGKLPTAIIACAGGGSNALGAFTAFIANEDVELVAVEPAGLGAETEKHGLSLGKGSPDVIHGFKTLVMHDDEGEIAESYSAASGLDYPGISPILSMLKENGRLALGGVTDKEAVDAFIALSHLEGIIPALESSHAIAYLFQDHGKYSNPDDIVVVNLSGRGDKDVENVFENLI
ncbi:MAG: tryptophan synthase subunit beta [Anaerolineae bacterium]|jgi:tryptophan synthase beta chain|nr:tryptophan synthase subunit beta [Anaerolineae bacterium]MBT7074841.1 tryptophan synthase subunit beta [Anaerolineae bacterium]MBT7782045.1 tryptophan synthase subunit beta [Anaerolineae bacterium]